MHGREKAGAVCRCQWSSPSTQPGHTSNVSFTILSEPVRAWSKISLISPAGLFSKKLLFAVTQRFVIIHEVKCSRERLLLIRPDLSVSQAAYLTRASWKNFFTRSGDFSNACMCSVAAAFNLVLVRTGTFV